MRIAQICPLIYACPPEKAGGTERVAADLTHALVELGHDVTLFAAQGSQTTATFVPSGPPITQVQGVPPGYAAAREAILLEKVRRRLDDFDVIHSHLEFMHAPVLGRDRSKLLATVHWRVDEADRQTYFEFFDDLAVVSISANQGAALPSNARHLGTQHHGIPAHRFTLGPGGPGAAFLGRMTDQKGPDRAISLARQAGMNITLAGNIDIGNPTYFEEQVRPMLCDDAQFLGQVDEAAKQALFGNAGVTIMPINWPEPFGLVMVESMACGTPVVAYDTGSVREVIDNGVTGFVVRSDGDFVDAIKRALSLNRRNVRARFEQRFSATAMARGYVHFYRQLAQQSAI